MWWVQAGAASYLGCPSVSCCTYFPCWQMNLCHRCCMNDHCLHLLAALSWLMGAACHLIVQGGCCTLDGSTGPIDSSRQPALLTCNSKLNSMRCLTLELRCRS